jgi:hypothetical protein
LYREYFYLLPAEIIGIKNGSTAEEIQEHLIEFNNILKGFKASMIKYVFLYAVELIVQKNRACEYVGFIIS